MTQAIESLPAVASDDELLELLKQLEAVQARRHSFEAKGSNGDDPHYRAYWWYRELIARRAARTPSGLRVKARAAELAFEYDGGYSPPDNGGTLVNLLHSLQRDITAILGIIENEAGH